MQLMQTALTGVYLIGIQKTDDDRGFFGRTWDAAIAQEHGLQERFDYTCISGNKAAHTLRGMHCQRAPHDEVKLVRCTKGAMIDVVIDLRPDSATCKQWVMEKLTADNHKALYIPAGCAHGFLTLEPDTEVLYHMAGEFVPEAAFGVRWNDPAFGIAWPAVPAVLSDRDAAYPDFAA